MAFPKKSMIAYLPVQTDDPTIAALASTRTERFVPANTVTTLTLGNVPIADHTLLWKNGTLMDDGATSAAYTIKGNVVTLLVAATGTDVFQVRYNFHTSR